MKIRIEEELGLAETEVIIRCSPGDSQTARLLAVLGEFQPAQKLTGIRDGQTYLLDFAQVLYADTVDKKTFLYTQEAVYETELRLYELESQLRGRDFFRASKSALVNFNAIQSLRPDLGGRIRLTMRGGEAIYVSRQYAPLLKKRLGL